MDNKESISHYTISRKELRNKIFKNSENDTAWSSYLERSYGSSRAWGIYESTLESPGISTSFPFINTFKKTIPEKTTMKKYIETELKKKKGSAIGIELGGTGSNLFADFTPGFFQKTAGVSLTDYRDSVNPLWKKEMKKEIISSFREISLMKTHERM